MQLVSIQTLQQLVDHVPLMIKGRIDFSPIGQSASHHKTTPEHAD